ncbi:DUF3850 domain-containing protein [Bradyrhizobium sp. CIAT3101]|uniref:DUF3850 domain-containing protein n=1 Tax=Bradyrhizobium sp. CIAT3101 TaxID=439387 RepID=UPI0024B114AB|nr:DUF3850 domain-containing protein [Bradyrhizobium sp. CIAT3101]WFU81275.1 DUF3850 domain-containing protein [Bradyrhizobium sp. CIAT3101]
MLNQANQVPLASVANITHHLKCWPQFFNEIVAGRKKHDLRRADDRNFRVGDTLVLEEYDPQRDAFTGRTLTVEVTYITSANLPCALSKEALHPNFCILSISPIPH